MDRDPEAWTRADAIARGLLERARPAVFRSAANDDEVASAQRLRGRAVIEQGWASEEALVDGRAIDPDDAAATHILGFLDGRAVATCRLVYPSAGQGLRLAMAAAGITLPDDAVELGRIVVIGGPSQRWTLSGGLLGAAWIELHGRGYHLVCGTATPGMLRVYRRLGFSATILGPAVSFFGEERFPITFQPVDDAMSSSVKRLAEPG